MSGLASLDRNTFRVLVVDDFAAMRKIVSATLKDLGFHNIVEAEDGKAAWEKLQLQSFDLIISDWNMPDMMGIDLLRNVRSHQSMGKTLFLMVTAEAQKERVLEAIKAGVFNYIVTPFTTEQLQQKLSAIYNKG
jgi:two-component system, chemotaxis family, chemotaxis protein CheY